MIRFHDSWLDEPALRDWLVKVSNDESRAYCRCCSIVLRAHKADLTTHAGTAKHAKNTESATLAGTVGPTVGPITVQIVSSSPTDDQQVAGNLINQTTSRGSFMDTNNFTFQRSPYTKRFRPEWQEIDELKDWLEPCQEDSTKAYCKMCDVQLRSHKHDLLLHGRSSKHKRCSAAAMASTTITTSSVISVEYENELSNPELVDTTKLTSTSEYVPGQIESIVQSVVNEIPCKKARVDMSEQHTDILHDVSSDEHHQHHVEILPHDSRHSTVNQVNGGTGEIDPMGDVKPQQISIIRVMDKPKNSTSIVYTQDNYNRSGGGPIRRRRGRIHAADVIRAVELNEFTGYEMLQILKSIARLL